MSEHFYVAAQAGVCRCTNTTTGIACVPLRTGEIGRHPGACRRKTNCCALAFERKNKIARPAVRTYSRA